jgi:hypothetical protein
MRVPTIRTRRAPGLVRASTPVRKYGPDVAGRGDHVLANKLVYDFSDPERGDLVVFNSVEAKNDELEVSGTGGRFPRSP